MKFRKIIFRCFIFFVIICALIIGSGYLYAKLSPKLEIKVANNITFYDKDKNSFFQGSESKKWISLDDISPVLVKATIAVEDKNFYKHFGFDFTRIAKAFYINIKNKKTAQGASTITQQYAKNLFLNFDKTWKRKWQEMLYTLRLEANYSKKEILEGYLNTIYYGHGMYGVENASNFYFNKSAKDLTLEEAAMLVGIPKSPNNYSPINNLKMAKKRQKTILNLMVKNNLISDSEANEAYDHELVFYGERDSYNYSTIMYYKDAVINELKSIKEIPDSYIDSKGLKIYTSLDINAQKNLEKNIKEQIPSESSVQVSSVMMNPNTGKIIALVGGRDYTKSQYNRAISTKRQVGSTMKPYLYYAALENGFTASSSFTSEATTFTFSERDDYSPQNYNQKYANKPISMATAIAYSDNIYAVKTNLFLGSDALINVAKRVGITSKLDDVPSLPLGTKEINIVEMTAGYAAFANLGYKVTPHLIERVEDSKGRVLYKAKNNKDLVLNSSLVFILNNLLTSTYDSNYIDYNYPTAISLASKLKHTYSLKSGTTETDNWYIGYNKNIVTSVWIGYDNNKTLVPSEYKYAQNIWYKSCEDYLADKKDEWYEKPSNVSGVLVEPISGKVVNNNSEKKKLVYFLKGTEPSLDTEDVFDEKFNSTNGD